MDLRKIKRQTLTYSAPKADEQEELSRFKDFLISRNGLLVFALDTADRGIINDRCNRIY